LKDIESKIADNNLTYEINTPKLNLTNLMVMSPELGQNAGTVQIRKVTDQTSTITVNLAGIKIYAVIQ
jgi:hypothetical protein